MKFTGHDPDSTLPNPLGCGCEVVLHPKPLETYDAVECVYGLPCRPVTIVRSERPTFEVKPCQAHAQGVLEATGVTFPAGFTEAVGR